MTKEEIYIYLYKTFPLCYIDKKHQYVYVEDGLNRKTYNRYGFKIGNGFYSIEYNNYNTVKIFWKHLVDKFKLNEVYSVRVCREYLKDYKECNISFKRIIKISNLL